MTTAKKDKAKIELQKLLDLFESGDVPEAVTKVLLPPRDVPSAEWSLANRMLCLLSGTDDARGYRQWENIGRNVKKGTKSFRILAPSFRKSKSNEQKAGQLLIDMGAAPKPAGDVNFILTGFRAVPVFRYEDTEGEAINRQEYEPRKLPPLADVAERFGCKVEYLGPGLDSSYYGFYAPDRQEIRLCTHHESTFFHELAHAAHHRVLGSMKPGQDWRQEIVAELCAAVLCRLYGIQYDGNAYRYIARHADEAKKNPHHACLSVLSDVEKTLNEILTTSETAVA